MMALQLVATALILWVGALAVRVGRAAGSTLSDGGQFWLLAGLVWCVHGGVQAMQNLWGVAAMAAGNASGTMAAYLTWAPSMNHSRTFLWLAACGVLVWFCFVRGAPGRAQWMIAVGWLAAGGVLGAVVGRGEGRLRPLTHFSNVAVLDAVELVVLLSTLLVALLRDRTDRYLWSGLLVWALTVAINVLWLAALSLEEDARTWSPSPITMGVYRVILVGILAGIFARRLRLARRGVVVAGLIGRSRAALTTLGH